MEAMKSMLVAASCLRVQAVRMREVADSLAYGGPSLTFKSVAAETPAWMNDMSRTFDFIRPDFVQLESELPVEEEAEAREHYMPGHPAADERGYVRADDRELPPETDSGSEAQVSYEAALGVYAAVA